VKKRDDETKQRIMQWFQNNSLEEIPKDAWHLVLLNSYYCAKENPERSSNLVEVTVLAERGVEMSGYQTAYFPLYRIQQWLKENCCEHERKRHVLSRLQSQTGRILRNDMYTYSLRGSQANDWCDGCKLS
jgi:hypothetical protein